MSLFKRLLNKGEGEGKSPNAPPAGMQTMGIQLQRRFAKGVQYNMRIVIRGDKNVGKTCLFHRLQGQKFKEEYIPTDEIQVASIQWNYKATDDVVKVEVWDVVDKGRKRRKLEGLKLETEVQTPEEPCLDAEFLDVYKGTHGVVFVFDVTKQWTFGYVEKEMEKVPPQLPVLVLGNHRDMGHHRTVSEDKARYYVEHLQTSRGEGMGKVRYAESSMRNGFGLKYLHMFFNLPFLQLQRETLLKQLETNLSDMASTVQELEIHEDSEEQNYDIFLDSLRKKRKEQQEVNNIQPVEGTQVTVNQDKALSPGSTGKEGATSPKADTPNVTTAPSTTPTSSVVADKQLPTPSAPVPPPNGAAPPSAAAKQTPEPEVQKSGLFSRLFKGNKAASATPPKTLDLPKTEQAPEVVKSVDDFVPDSDGLDRAFLEDAKEPANVAKDMDRMDSDSEEEEEANPMVAGFQDDLDSDDDLASGAVQSGNPMVRQASSSSEEEQKPGHVVMPASDVSDSEDDVVARSVVARDSEDVDVEGSVVSNGRALKGSVKGPGSVARPNIADIVVTDSEEEEEEEEKKEEEKKEQIKVSQSVIKQSEKQLSLSKTQTYSSGPSALPVSDPKDSNKNNVSEEGTQSEEEEEEGGQPHSIQDIPQEDLSNWLDQFETKVFVSEPPPERPKKPAKSKSTKSRTPKHDSDDDDDDDDEDKNRNDSDDNVIHVKKIQSDIDEDIASEEPPVVKKKKKKKTNNKDVDGTEKKTKKKKGEKEDKKKDKEKSSKEGDGKKKKKKKAEKTVGEKENNDLEAFLEGVSGDYETL